MAIPLAPPLAALPQPRGIVLSQCHAQSGRIVYQTLQHAAIIVPWP
jgi:hypothetical protein